MVSITIYIHPSTIPDSPLMSRFKLNYKIHDFFLIDDAIKARYQFCRPRYEIASCVRRDSFGKIDEQENDSVITINRDFMVRTQIQLAEEQSQKLGIVQKCLHLKIFTLNG